MTDFADNRAGQEDSEPFVHINSTGEITELDQFDPRLYRAFSLTLSVTLHDIQAHLVKVHVLNFHYLKIFIPYMIQTKNVISEKLILFVFVNRNIQKTHYQKFLLADRDIVY